VISILNVKNNKKTEGIKVSGTAHGHNTIHRAVLLCCTKSIKPTAARFAQSSVTIYQSCCCCCCAGDNSQCQSQVGLGLRLLIGSAAASFR